MLYLRSHNALVDCSPLVLGSCTMTLFSGDQAAFLHPRPSCLLDVSMTSHSGEKCLSSSTSDNMWFVATMRYAFGEPPVVVSCCVGSPATTGCPRGLPIELPTHKPTLNNRIAATLSSSSPVNKIVVRASCVTWYAAFCDNDFANQLASCVILLSRVALDVTACR